MFYSLLPLRLLLLLYLLPNLHLTRQSFAPPLFNAFPVCQLLFGVVFTSRTTTALSTFNISVLVRDGQKQADEIAAKYGFCKATKIFDGLNYFVLETEPRRAKRSILDDVDKLSKESNVEWVELQVAKKRVKRKVDVDDPKWAKMWYMNSEYVTGSDMSIEKAWTRGLTGRGVTVAILDDGIELTHPDLQMNYEPFASFDLNDNDYDPTPRYDRLGENKHGTRCAGQVAAEAGNNECIVGVAYNSRIGGIRMLDGDVTDLIEAKALSFRSNLIDIYSASWGPDDNGRTVDGPGRLTRVALELGARTGRRGRGSIYVWASGNGGREGDDCGCDGYANSIYTITVSSCTENGDLPWYAESCSAALVSTYSSGTLLEKKVITTDTHHGCTESHSGTSASAPIVAGVVALMIEANPLLTWRDVQYILVLSARWQFIRSDTWIRNGAGLYISQYFGFGLVDADYATLLAAEWIELPEQHKCVYHIIPKKISTQKISSPGTSLVSFRTNGCRKHRNEVSFMEHVEVVISMRSPRRGDVSFSITSPSGTNSTLLTFRPKDTSNRPFKNWRLMTTHFWGESAEGRWRLEVKNKFRGWPI
ncbi:hypothetical protein ACOME3_010536 [Neoechinorhynchus agilis]